MLNNNESSQFLNEEAIVCKTDLVNSSKFKIFNTIKHAEIL